MYKRRTKQLVTAIALRYDDLSIFSTLINSVYTSVTSFVDKN